MATEKKKAILMLAFGGPDGPGDVEPFIKNVLAGKEVPPVVIEKAKERYKLIGGSSPLLAITKKQASGLAALLKGAGADVPVYVAMRYWKPYIKDVIKQMADDGVTETLAFIMAPFNSIAATGGYGKDLEEARRAFNPSSTVEYLSDWHVNPKYIDLLDENISAAMKGLTKEETLVILSSHSLPMVSLEGDSYEMKVHQTWQLLLKKHPLDYKLAYQSKGTGPRDWLGPFTEEIIAEAAAQGKKAVVVVPFGFAADHVETLYDIDILFKGAAERLGLEFRRCASLNDSAKYLDILAGLVKKRWGIK